MRVRVGAVRVDYGATFCAAQGREDTNGERERCAINRDCVRACISKSLAHWLVRIPPSHQATKPPNHRRTAVACSTDAVIGRANRIWSTVYCGACMCVGRPPIRPFLRPCVLRSERQLRICRDSAHSNSLLAVRTVRAQFRFSVIYANIRTDGTHRSPSSRCLRPKPTAKRMRATQYHSSHAQRTNALQPDCARDMHNKA